MTIRDIPRSPFKHRTFPDLRHLCQMSMIRQRKWDISDGKKKEKKRTMDDSLIWQCFLKKALLTCLTVHKHLSLLASNYELEKMQEWFENGTILLS